MKQYNGSVGSSGTSGTPGIPSDKIYTPCCGKRVDYLPAIGWYCRVCKTHYLTLDLVSLEEFKNKKRTSLIDKILE